MDTYLTIKTLSEGLYKEKGSRFIAFAIPIETIEEAKGHLNRLHKKYHNARHICYAYILGVDKSIYRVYDDGEPSGTAGKPLHGALLSNDLTDVLIAVVRYFGGVKLGTGGLITAYREAAVDAINNSEIIEKTVQVYYSISFQYPVMNDVMRLLKDKDCKIIVQSFDNHCEIEFSVRKSDAGFLESKIQLVDNLKLKLLKTK